MSQEGQYPLVLAILYNDTFVLYSICNRYTVEEEMIRNANSPVQHPVQYIKQKMNTNIKGPVLSSIIQDKRKAKRAVVPNRWPSGNFSKAKIKKKTDTDMNDNKAK